MLNNTQLETLIRNLIIRMNRLEANAVHSGGADTLRDKLESAINILEDAATKMRATLPDAR